MAPARPASTRPAAGQHASASPAPASPAPGQPTQPSLSAQPGPPDPEAPDPGAPDPGAPDPKSPDQEDPEAPGPEAPEQAAQEQAARGAEPAHSEGLTAVVAALAANLGIAATKFVAYFITGSASMLAEGVHSVADSGNQLLLLLGRNRARRDRTEEHPFGFGRERYFYAFVVAVVLFTVGALFSIYEGIHKITHPEPISDPIVAFVVLALAIVLESLSLRTAVRESREQRNGDNWLIFIRRAKAPELPAILLEDMAALTGLLLATAGVALTVITGEEAWDGAGSLAIGILLGCVAAILAVEMKSLLIGESASVEVERAIVTALEAGPEVECVIHLRTLHLGPETLLVTAKVAVRPCDRAEQVTAGIDAAERRVRAAVPIAKVIYLEPDLYRESRADATDPAIRAVRRRPRR